jgi:Flp pilus assembly protein TadG
MAVRLCPARRRDDRGASAVEFALVVPLLIMVLFGFISTGQAYSDHLSASNAAREAARYGAATDFSASPSDWAISVRDRLKDTYFNEGFQVTDDMICVRLVTSTGTQVANYAGTNCGAPPAAPANMAPGSCAVLVSVQRPRTIELIVFPNLNFTIRGASVAYYGREVEPTCPEA